LSRRAAARAALLALAGGALFLAAWRGGLPAFAHDWQISPEWGQYREACASLGNVVARDNFGGPNAYLYTYPFALACRLAVLPFSSAAWLGIELFALGALNATGAAALLRALGVRSALAAGLGAILFVASPLFVNELAAGHLLYCWGTAGLAWGCAFSLRLAERGTLADLCRAAAAWAVALLTIQFTLVLVPLVALLLVRGPRRLGVAALLGLIVLLELPTAAVVAFADPAAFLHADRVTVHWQLNLSTSVPNALSGFGYFAGYAERAYGALAPPFVWLRIALLVAGAAIALRVRDAGRLTAFAAAGAGALLVAGLEGPLDAPLEFVFRTLPQAAVFRELYHFSVLPALGVCLAGATLAELPRIGKTAAAACAVLAVGAAAPFLTGSVLGGAPRLGERDIAGWRAVVAAVDPSLASGAVLYVPNLQPLGPSPAESGVDPESFAIAGHPALYQFQPDPDVAWAYARYRAGDLVTLAHADVVAAVVRPQWHSFRYQKAETALLPLAALCTSGPSGAPRAPRIEPFPAAAAGWRAAVPPADYLGLPESSVVDDDPRHDWVDGTRWSGCFPALAELPTETRFTLSRRALLLDPPPGRHDFLAWAPQGAYLDDGARRRRLAPAPHFSIVHSGGALRISSGGGPVAVTGWIARGEDPFWWRSSAGCGRYAMLARRVDPYSRLDGELATPQGSFPLAAEVPGCGAPAPRPTLLAYGVGALQAASEGSFVILVVLGSALRATRTPRS
jgi:hypothetical protein